MIGFVGLLALLTPGGAVARDLFVAQPPSGQSLAFARYVASTEERDPLTESGPVAVEIDGTLPGLYKESRLLAVKLTGESERGEYRVLGIEGDATVTQEVIARYLAVQEQVEDMPLSSVAITPANYKFHYLGEVETGGAPAYVYKIIPRKKRDGLIQGQLWIDSATGAAILQAGYFVKTPSAFTGRMEVVRDTQLQDGNPSVRITHVTIETPRVGRGQLKITEFPLSAVEDEQRPQAAPLIQN
jgi:hypothetical protein